MATADGDLPAVHVHGKTAAATATVRDVLSVGSPLCGARLAGAGDAAPAFDVAAYFALHQAGRMGVTACVAATIPSTQTFMAENFDALPEGTLCVADVQASGRGRGENTWSSPPGCLMFSFNTRLRDASTLPFLQYVVTLAVVEAAQALARDMLTAAGVADVGPHPLELRIKWPNDVYGRGLKVGGVLCGSTHSDGFFRVTVGVGLNATNAEPTTCVAALIQAAAAAAGAPPGALPPLSREALLAAVMGRYEALEARFVGEGGFEGLREAYLSHWLHTGQQVTLLEPPQAEVRLTIRGLARSGYLLAEDERGGLCELHPDGNSLDFWKGLIRRKVSV